ncbi:MAG: hypothetical protein COR54_06205 [Elusimicrobia bacterium CG22_combo_CG10-13_8_21_14_all_63_91]|nr:MAG: hypothetical protein COR54_06205 [Elusimicrobia bacterium CG22_combo_CG10-13_8_21_14_all_63_91]
MLDGNRAVGPRASVLFAARRFDGVRFLLGDDRREFGLLGRRAAHPRVRSRDDGEQREGEHAAPHALQGVGFGFGQDQVFDDGFVH